MKTGIPIGLLVRRVQNDLISAGHVEFEAVSRYADAGIHAWGTTMHDGERLAFVVCRTPSSFPSSAMLLGESIEEIVEVLVCLGLASGRDLEALLAPAIGEN